MTSSTDERDLTRAILDAFQRAVARERLDAADHLLKALEVLCDSNDADPVLAAAYLMIAAPAPRRAGVSRAKERAHGLS